MNNVDDQIKVEDLKMSFHTTDAYDATIRIEVCCKDYFLRRRILENIFVETAEFDYNKLVSEDQITSTKYTILVKEKKNSK